MNRRKYHKIQTRFEKKMKLKERVIDMTSSVIHISRKDAKDAIAYAIYYTANPDSEMCVPNCAYIQAEKMFEKWKEEK